MHSVEILLLTLFTAGYGQEPKAHTEHPPVIMNEVKYSTEHRHNHDRYKRSDCSFLMALNCYCDDGCWLDSYRFTFSTTCGTGVHLNCCVIQSSNSYQLSTTCPEHGTYLYLSCSQTGGICYDGMTPYQCTCSDGYLPSTTTTSATTVITTVKTSATTVITTVKTVATPPSDSPTDIVALIVVLPIVIVCGIAIAATLLYRFHKHRNSSMLNINILAGVIPIQCNVMAVVDDVDEFKDYTKRLMIALQDRFPKLVFERVSRYDMLNDNYDITCDKLLVFRRTDDAKLNVHKLDALMKKVKFRNYKERLTVVICMGNNLTNNTEVKEAVDELCLVRSMKHIADWLPAVIKTVFGVNERCFGIYNSTFFIKSVESTLNSEYCKELQHTVGNILTEFGAAVAESENAAKCKLVFLDSVDDISLQGDTTTHKNIYMFVSSGTSLRSFQQNSDMNVYGRKDTILGIIRLLFNLNLISCKGLPNIEAMRYNPITKEFAQYNKNKYCCV